MNITSTCFIKKENASNTLIFSKNNNHYLLIISCPNMKIIAGSASKKLGLNLSKRLDISLTETEIKRFPDKECYVRICENLDGEDVAIIQTTYPDENLIELFLLQDAIKHFDVKSLTTIIPYFGYGRQDKIFKEGEAESAKALAKHIELQSDKILTVDPHTVERMLEWFDIPIEIVSGGPAIANYLKKFDLDGILSPDEGSIDRAKYVANILNIDFDYLEKTRLSGEEVIMKPKNLDVEGKVIAIVDDIISTGGTISTASSQLKENGAKKIIAVCTHGLFAKDALQKMEKYCDEIISSDTIETDKSEITLADEISNILIK